MTCVYCVYLLDVYATENSRQDVTSKGISTTAASELYI